MLKTTLIVIAILGVLAVVGIAWAKHKGYCAGADYLQHASERVARELDLNDEQNGRLQGFVETLGGLRASWLDHRTELIDELEGLLAAPTLDRERVVDVLDERHQAMVVRRQEIVDAFADFSDSLQPEQRDRLADLIAARMQQRWGHPRWAH